MANYYSNEAVFDLPERPFADKTVHGLEAKLPSGKTLGVLVHRRPVDGAKSLRQIVDDSVALNVKRLSAFTVLEQREADVGGVPAILVRTQWRNAGVVLYQLQAHVVFGAQAMIFAVSAPIEDKAACEETFGSILETITWRTE
jgi:hypothetical protein